MTMTSTTSEKVKEIAVKSLSYFLNHDYYDHDESFDVWAATEEGSRLVGELVEDWVKLEKGCKMPDYDEMVLWFRESHTMYLEMIDKDDSDWWNEVDINFGKTTHWIKIQPPKIN